ncbi:MAG: putative DNA binding domain-containing protein, partial [Nanoarchaeota archaeon]|nr:putative DNA binding domain-containing protein [Nanoarchaeota archaeon]MBU1703904.1 putative DNA binding domain-containing protein [Nanoarchaeota archaeon]
MEHKEIIDLIKTGEGYTLELKEGLNTSIGKDICAFANASGGKIILGVRDDGSVKGFRLTNSDSSKIHDITRNMDPSFNVTYDVVDNLTIIYVPEGKDKPYSVNGHFYLRQSASSQQLRRDEIREFFEKENKIQFDKKANAEFIMVEDFDKAKFDSFVKKLSLSSEFSQAHILKNLNLMTNDRVNNAGVLFFSHRISKFFMNAVIACVLYQSDSRANILDKKEFDADFVTNFDNAINFVLKNINTNIEIVGRKRVEKPEISEEALREAIINAMVHRDYFSNGRVQIDVFSDRVEISNPGKLLFDEKDFGNVSIARNPIIADITHRLGYVERIGSGIKRIKGLVKDAEFRFSSDWFRVVFLRKATPKTT